MRIDQAWQNCFACDIFYNGCCTFGFQHFFVAACLQDFSILDCHGLNDGEFFIHGNDLGIMEYKIGRLGEGDRG